MARSALGQAPGQCFDDLCRHFILDRKHVIEAPVIALGPQVIAGCDINQLHIDANPLKRPVEHCPLWRAHGPLQRGARRPPRHRHGEQAAVRSPSDRAGHREVRRLERRLRAVPIDHGLGIVTRYAHIHAINVKVGDVVDYRQEIGKLGSSGLVSRAARPFRNSL